METSSKKWAKDLKLSVINEDSKKLQEIYGTIPDFSKSGFSLEELQEVEALMKQAVKILEVSKDELAKEMNQVKATIAYQKNMIK